MADSLMEQFLKETVAFLIWPMYHSNMKHLLHQNALQGANLSVACKGNDSVATGESVKSNQGTNYTVS